MTARTAGIDRNDVITSLSAYDSASYGIRVVFDYCPSTKLQVHKLVEGRRFCGVLKIAPIDKASRR